MSLHSTRRYAADRKAARDAVYRSSGAGPNPYPPGTRPHRLWDKERESYLRRERQMSDLIEAYGHT